MRTGKIERLSLEQWGHVFSIVGVLLGLVSLASVLAQLREHNKITRAENAQKLVELTMASHMEMIKDPRLASLWREGIEGYDSLGEGDKERYRRLWIIYFNILESAFHQREDGLIDEEDFRSTHMCILINKRSAFKVWPELSGFYPARFQRHVAGVLGTRDGKAVGGGGRED
jgi:hypothetical protein